MLHLNENITITHSEKIIIGENSTLTDNLTIENNCDELIIKKNARIAGKINIIHLNNLTIEDHASIENLEITHTKNVTQSDSAQIKNIK